jgi:hypothetical protein
VLISTTVQNREMQIPLFLSDVTKGKDQLHALVRSINNAIAQRPLLIEWRDANASASTFFDCPFARFEPSFNFRRSGAGYAAGVLHCWTSGFGHTGTVRVTATAAGTGIFLSVPIASLAGDAPALLDTTINAGAVVPSLGRIVAVAPITNPSYAPRIPAASLTDLQTNATLVGASGADGSQYLALPVQPTGGASGVACKVPLPNPTIAGGDNRILAVVKSGIDAGVGIYALDPYGNSMGATAIASNTQSWAVVDLGVCRLPTVGYPTLPKIQINAGAVWASGAAGPVILASPAALAINEIFCLPDKNLTLIHERGAGGSLISKDGFAHSAAALNANHDDLSNPWAEGWNNNVSGPNLVFENAPAGRAYIFGGASVLDSSHIVAILTDSMLITVKPSFDNPGSGGDTRLVKESATGVYVQGRVTCNGATYSLDLAAATNTTLNTLASLAFATLSFSQKYRLALQVQGPGAFVNLTRDDGGPVFIPGSAAYASVGVASNAAVGGAGVPGIGLLGRSGAAADVHVYSWEVDTIPTSNLLAYDAYAISGNNIDSYRVSSAGVFGAKLTAVQRGAYPKMQPSTTSLAVVCAPVDQGVANDLISAVISVKERFTYGR